MKIKTYIAGPLDANNYLVWDEKTKEAVLIDCSEYKQEIINDINQLGLKVKYILLTHGHFDHVLGINEMVKATNAKVYVNKNDVELIENINEFGKLFGFDNIEPPHIDFNIEDEDIINLGDIEIKTLATPGHTEGGVCYLAENNLFSGDTLFKGTYGRTDLFGGNFAKLINSLKNVIFKLDDNITVYPGHGDRSDIRYEKEFNDING